MPVMYVVAGPSGSGKTSAFPGSCFGCDYFNADDYAAQLNGGSYLGIPMSIRKEAGTVCEKFIEDQIVAGKDFATETTLRSTLVFDQMKRAHDAGFAVRFSYVCVNNIDTLIDRVAGRAVLGGHSASEETIREIRAKSLGNLPRVLKELGKTIDLLNLYDNSVFGISPKRIASFQGRAIVFIVAELPAWLEEALEKTACSAAILKSSFLQGIPLPESD